MAMHLNLTCFRACASIHHDITFPVTTLGGGHPPCSVILYMNLYPIKPIKFISTANSFNMGFLKSLCIYSGMFAFAFAFTFGASVEY